MRLRARERMCRHIRIGLVVEGGAVRVVGVHGTIDDGTAHVAGMEDGTRRTEPLMPLPSPTPEPSRAEPARAEARRSLRRFL